MITDFFLDRTLRVDTFLSVGWDADEQSLCLYTAAFDAPSMKRVGSMRYPIEQQGNWTFIRLHGPPAFSYGEGPVL